ncbi:MAG: DUF2309 domain-containing protein [Aquabacterium sp.]|nr:DUF2309 domain-containing protein [Aquabacterium sp.]
MEMQSTPALVSQACAQACQMIAPTWPLDRSIAVNPHWQRVGRPVREVAARMAVLAGIQVLPTRAYLLEAWQSGRISQADLNWALVQKRPDTAALTPEQCVDALSRPLNLPRLPLLIDVLDDDPARHKRLSWRQAITHQVSQSCAAYFDEHQADWQPQRDEGLYAFWRDTLLHDHGIGLLMGLPHLKQGLGALPATREDAERWAMQRLGLPADVWADYLEAVLLSINGWASWCAYLGWQAQLNGDPADVAQAPLRDLLAIRLAWGALLLECKDDKAARQAFAALQNDWRQAGNRLAQAQARLLVDEVWQVALEAGYQRNLATQLTGHTGQASPATAPQPIQVQAAFCIDVRSEPFRRALEAAWPAVQTVGFAGFFGLPVAYTPLGTTARRPQLPGLLAPALDVQDTGPHASAISQARQDGFAWSEALETASRWPAAAFSFVEAAGVGYLGKLGRWLAPDTGERPRDDLDGVPVRYRPVCCPALIGLNTEAKVNLAARVLHAMGLDHDLAPLVLLVGHGSHSTNNAHAASLDCGACGGQTGEVNARVLAGLLNEPEVRAGLLAQGLPIAPHTVFVAALHNTTTDEIEVFDADALPESARANWAQLQTALHQAGNQVRRERAPSLGLDAQADADALFKTYRRRANDGAQTRPEWGLAGNAAFIIAPRTRTRGLNLGGRTFLHDYDASHDADGSVLELLMTAPMLVTNWINWQYHASTCEPARFGSGNKVLHNVVGGNLGVFEGNGGDLRIGLSQQSVHDGNRWMHEPLRLTVVIDAPQAAIDTIVAKHAIVRQLLDHEWLHLWRMEGAGLQRYVQGQWQSLGGLV